MKQPKVKLILHTSAEDLLFVAGRSGRINLLGGGTEPGESELDTLYREIHEEAGITPFMITNPRWCGIASGPVTAGDGAPAAASWEVFEADLLVPIAQLAIGAEIVSQHILNREAAMTHTHVTEMAKLALQLK